MSLFSKSCFRRQRKNVLEHSFPKELPHFWEIRITNREPTKYLKISQVWRFSLSLQQYQRDQIWQNFHRFGKTLLVF